MALFTIAAYQDWDTGFFSLQKPKKRTEISTKNELNLVKSIKAFFSQQYDLTLALKNFCRLANAMSLINSPSQATCSTVTMAICRVRRTKFNILKLGYLGDLMAPFHRFGTE